MSKLIREVAERRVMGWAVGEKLRIDPRYRDLLARIEHPVLQFLDGA